MLTVSSEHSITFHEIIRGAFKIVESATSKLKSSSSSIDKKTLFALNDELLEKVQNMVYTLVAHEFIGESDIPVGESPDELLFNLLTYLYSETDFFHDTPDLHHDVGESLGKYHSMKNCSVKEVITSTIVDYKKTLSNSKHYDHKEYLFFWLEHDFLEIEEADEYTLEHQKSMERFLLFLYAQKLLNSRSLEEYKIAITNSERKFDVVKYIFILGFLDEDERIHDTVGDILGQYYEELDSSYTNEEENSMEIQDITSDSLKIFKILTSGNFSNNHNFIENYLNYLESNRILEIDVIRNFHEQYSELYSSPEELKALYEEYLYDCLFLVLYYGYFDENSLNLSLIGTSLIDYYKKDLLRTSDIMDHCKLQNVFLSSK